MPKNVAEDKEKLKEKLEYIGLNLERVPKFLKEFIPFSFRPSKSYDDMRYKVYRYIDVTDIKILLTPTDRLTNLNEKYKLATPLGSYLDSDTEENIERFTTFLRMLNDIDLIEFKKTEKEQEKLKEQLPYEIKYNNNYIWQIYYSDISDQYFMLVPTNEYNNTALFYLLKKQIEAKKTRKKEYIYVPISHQEYSGNFLVKSQIADLENYLWYFTKEWPNIYEVYDAKGKMKLVISGKTNVYEDIQSNYVITLQDREKALEKYKLIKALFILATGLPQDYTFKTRINNLGELDFAYIYEKQETIIKYSNLLDFIQKQVNQKRLFVGVEDKKILEEQEKLQELKETVEKQTEEYLSKQRQIATFLECKKTFFGKVKYYFSNRKKEFQDANRSRIKNNNTKQKKELKKEEIDLKENNEPYTIEDLIEICTKLEARRKMVKNLKLDTNAQELKKINLDRKIKNANIYLNEIELHKKSIFEFWKFTNKDELPGLNEGEGEEKESKEKLFKRFDYENDAEDLGKQVDEIQRRKLSKNETDGVFAIKQVLESSQILNKSKSEQLTEDQKQLIEQELKSLKTKYEKDLELIQVKDFDVFGGMSDDKTKIKTLNNQKHREIEKDKYKILNITAQTELSIYMDNLKNYLKLAKEAFYKIKSKYNMPIYLGVEKEVDLNNLQILHMNPEKAIQDQKNQKEIYLYRFNLEENMPLLYYSNIIFFDNFNQTLPLGMNLSDEVLIDFNFYSLKEKQRETFQINDKEDEYINSVIKVNVIEYDMKLKKNI